MKKNIVKSACLIWLFLLFASGVAGQDSTGCGLTDAPRLLGLQLGMSVTQAQDVFGKALRVKVKTKGDRVFFQNYIRKSPPAVLSGVRALYLRFLDGVLYQIEIFYDGSRNAPTLESFTARLSSEFKFPANAEWRFEYNKAVIDCGAFTLTADKPVDPRVELTDTLKRDEAFARREESD